MTDINSIVVPNLGINLKLDISILISFILKDDEIFELLGYTESINYRKEIQWQKAKMYRNLLKQNLQNH
jgi:hypothetical protein